MNAAIITIGDEILIGQITDTNAAWIAQQLSRIGFTVRRKYSVGDNADDIRQVLADAGSLADLVLITGGLGPTPDDITRKVLFRFFGSKPVVNTDVLYQVEQFLIQRNVKMNELNRNQAVVADNCIVIHNEIGTAPGMWFEKNGTVFVSMPGVPFEMKQMMETTLLGKFAETFKTPVIIHTNILTTGIGESMLAEMISDWETNLPGSMKLAYLPEPGILKLRITASGSNREILMEEIRGKIESLKLIIGKYIFGIDDQNIEGIIGQLLTDSGKTISVAESCTGGSIGKALTSVAGSSAYFRGGIIAYSNDIKSQFLSVTDEMLQDHGAVSSMVVEQMAKAVRKNFGSDLSIAVSGIAGPGGGTSEKPVGTTWIAVASAERVISKRFLFGEHRGRNITKATIAALNMLRKFMMEM